MLKKYQDKPVSKPFGSIIGRLRLLKKEDIYKKVVLDVGCGRGWFEIYIRRWKPKSIAGIDPSGKAIEIAKKSNDLKHTTFRVGSALELPYKKSSFDTVVSWEVIEHIPYGTEDIYFTEMHRVLKNGGKAYISTPYAHIISKIFDPAWWLIGHRHYSVTDLKVLTSAAGFDVVNIYTGGGVYSILYNLSMYGSKWIFGSEPLFGSFLRKKATSEYKLRNGFVTVFMELQKK